MVGQRGAWIFLAVVALAVSGCGHRVSDDGPIEQGVGSGGFCTTPRGHASFVLGDQVLQNKGRLPVVVDDVRLDDPVNMSISQARVGPVYRTGPKGLFGLTYRDPAHWYPEQRGVWDAGTDAVGAVIQPGEHATKNLLVAVDLTDPAASARTQLVVDYHDALRRYEWHEDFTYEVRSRCRGRG